MQPAATLDQLLKHWEGHRRLTRRTIEAFPEDELFSYRVEPMRPFGEMIREALEIGPLLRGVVENVWEWNMDYEEVGNKADLLDAWDQSLETIRSYWQRLGPEQLERVEPDHFFGGPPQANLDRLLYTIDNEIHHRGQGFVYLRLLGIEPPPFFER